MYAVGIQPERCGQQVQRLLGVPVTVVRRHPALVAPPQLDP
jgi:hypothetical protein